MEKKFDPVLSKPYYFQNSKRFAGKSLEYLILNNSSAFFSLKDKPHREGDVMHRHIEFLLTAGDDMNIDFLCPFCGKNSVRFILFRNCSFLSINLSCCDNSFCKKELQAGSGDRLIALKLRNLRQFSKASNKKKAERIFKKFLALKSNSKPEEIFEAITSKYKAKFKQQPIKQSIQINQSTKKVSQLKLF